MFAGNVGLFSVGYLKRSRSVLLYILTKSSSSGFFYKFKVVTSTPLTKENVKSNIVLRSKIN